MRLAVVVGVESRCLKMLTTKRVRSLSSVGMEDKQPRRRKACSCRHWMSALDTIGQD